MALGKELILRDPSPPQSLGCPHVPAPPHKTFLSWLKRWGLEREWPQQKAEVSRAAQSLPSPLSCLSTSGKGQKWGTGGQRLRLSPGQDPQLVTSQLLLPALQGLRNPLLGYNSGDLATVSRQPLPGDYDSAAAQGKQEF